MCVTPKCFLFLLKLGARKRSLAEGPLRQMFVGNSFSFSVRRKLDPEEGESQLDRGHLEWP